MSFPSPSEVFAWLDKNVPRYPTPQSVHLRNFEIDWKSLKGSFEIILDDTPLSERFSMSLEITGWMRFWMPMIHSPLGAPASYGAIDLTSETCDAIEKGLKQLLPRLYGVGLHPLTGAWVDADPVVSRIPDQAAFGSARMKIESPDFSITVPIPK
jgi:hypothetical protein